MSNADLNDSTGNTMYLNGTIYVEYYNTSGVLVQETFSTPETFYVCGSSSGTSPDIFYYKNNVLISPVDSSFQFLGGSNCTQPFSCYPVYSYDLGFIDPIYQPDCEGACLAATLFNTCFDAVQFTVTSAGSFNWTDCDDVLHTTYVGTTGTYSLVGCVKYGSVNTDVTVPLQPAGIENIEYGSSTCT